MSNFDFDEIKIASINNDYRLTFREIQVWIDGSNIAQRDDVDVSARTVQYAFNWGVDELENVYYSSFTNPNNEFFSLKWPKRFPIENVESVVVYNNTWDINNWKLIRSYKLQFCRNNIAFYEQPFFDNDNYENGVSVFRFDGPKIKNVTSFSDSDFSSNAIISSNYVPDFDVDALFDAATNNAGIIAHPYVISRTILPFFINPSDSPFTVKNNDLFAHVFSIDFKIRGLDTDGTVNSCAISVSIGSGDKY